CDSLAAYWNKTCLGTTLTLEEPGESPSISQTQPGATNPVREAILLSLRTSLLDFDRFAEADRRESFACLYGTYYESGGFLPYKPPFRVTIALILQRILAALFIFLFGLGIRNMLRVK